MRLALFLVLTLTLTACGEQRLCTQAHGGCDVNATCTQGPSFAECACAEGFAGDGRRCADVDECASGSGGCDANATCTNTVGGRTCRCLAGFEGDGLACADVDECATANGGCATEARCTNTLGGRGCACRPGYAGDGVSCEDVDECATANGGCHARAECENTPGAHACRCRPGFAGDGESCEDVDECAAQHGGCHPDAACVNGIGGRTCTCLEGFLGDGVACEDVDECAAEHGGCLAQARCTNVRGGRECTCPGGFAGDAITECRPVGVWARQGRGAGFDLGQDVAVDAQGRVYVVGQTSYSTPLDGEAPLGDSDGFVARFDPDGTRRWTRLFGDGGMDNATGVAIDTLQRVLVCGAGGPRGGATPAEIRARSFLRAFDADGVQLWARTYDLDTTYGTTAMTIAAAPDATSYLGGRVHQGAAFVARLDADGALLWTTQLGGGSTTWARGLAADAGGVYAIAPDGLGGGVLSRLRADGSLAWSHALEAGVEPYGLALDADGHLGVAGVIAVSAGGLVQHDAVVASYDADGLLRWSRTVGGPALDGAFGLAAHPGGGFVAAGKTRGVIGGGASRGGDDFFVLRVDASGGVVSLTQEGTAGHDQANAVAVDTQGRSYVTGYVDGPFAAPFSGGNGDYFLLRVE